VVQGGRGPKRDGKKEEDCKEFAKKSGVSSEQRKSRTKAGRNDRKKNWEDYQEEGGTEIYSR